MVTSATRLHGRREPGQPDVIQGVHVEVVQVAPHVPDAAILGTNLLNGSWTLSSTGSSCWVTTVQDLQRATVVAVTSVTWTMTGIMFLYVHT